MTTAGYLLETCKRRPWAEVLYNKANVKMDNEQQYQSMTKNREEKLGGESINDSIQLYTKCNIVIITSARGDNHVHMCHVDWLFFSVIQYSMG